jgi:hypothetical protein
MTVFASRPRHLVARGRFGGRSSLVVGSLLAAAAACFAGWRPWAPGQAAGRLPDSASASLSGAEPGRPVGADLVAVESPLIAGYDAMARWVREQLGPDAPVQVRGPLVIGGDLSAAELETWGRETIDPALRAMTSAYFATPPTEPVVILLFATEASYREHAARLFGDREVSRYGYYRPHLRIIMVSAECGPDALRHELTHALMAFDFPEAPEWLREGLASLHEHGKIRDDGGEILGLPNWRFGVLRDAIRQGRLSPLRSLFAAGSFRGPDERLNYARARYFCMYLQSRGLLGACYRACRAAIKGDPTGEQAVAGLFPGRSWEQLDADFRAWLGSLRGPAP